jgi:hypothetical protein
MASLDQARAARDDPKARRAQELASCRVDLFCRATVRRDRPQRERDRSNDHERTEQEPNDLNRYDAVDHESGTEIALISTAFGSASAYVVLSQANGFVPIVLAVALAALATAPTMPLLDAYALRGLAPCGFTR